MLTLEQTLAHFKIRITPDFAATKMQRDGAQWLRAYRSTVDGHSQDFVYFGDYKTGVKDEWKGDTSHLPEDAQKKLQATQKKQRAELAREESEENIRLKLEYEAEWPRFTDRGTTAYLEKKKISALFGCKIDVNVHGPYLLVPARDIDGQLWNWQRVYNEKLSAGGNKFFRRGRKQGLFHLLGEIKDEDTIYFAEGFATAASIHMALAVPVVCAFDCGNLLPVARAFRARYPRNAFVFCADDDRENVDHNGKPTNPGLESAYACRDEVRGTVRYPRFKDPDGRSDFNDLHCFEGLDEVKRQLTEDAEQPGPKVAEYSLAEASIVRAILEEYAAGIMKVEEDVFLYTGTHWKLYDKPRARDLFRKKLDAMSKGRWKFKDIVSAYSRLLMHIPNTPEGVDLYSPRPECVNLLNGTLHIVRGRDGTRTLELRPHNREDYLSNLIDFRYEKDGPHNLKLLEVVGKIFGADPDREAKAQGIQEMFGAALCGEFPMLFMLHGKPGTGKSTVANIVKRLIGERNTCQVPPTQWTGFHMWPMLGKQVNIDTDIPTQGRIQDDMIKKVVERGLVYVQRKNMANVTTRLPAANIFCANALPPFVDGSSGAQERRWIAFEFLHRVIPEGDRYDRLYWDQVFESDPQGVFNFAVAGLERLCERMGAFTVSESSRAKVRAWEESSDEAGQAVMEFLEDVRNGEVADSKNSIVLLGDDHKIEPKRIWEIFKMTFEGNSLKYGGPRKHDFYAAFQRSGFSRYKSDGVWYFKGIGVKESAEGVL